ncbi:MAG: membrane protein [Bdellovibrio sp. ArHS]|uniref:OmpA family protein n=1 Tax=Bdellovibrio sp. ArHS TaxID=1569284 RepID=UPI0005836846|nr:OmpA family protein [Bdellovibrio sp. ArHS]KHD87203.1 MAG: membrane protein [Bdellovibrio sp. ArHS]
MKTLILTAILCVGSFSYANQARQDSTSSTMEFTREEAETAPRGLLPFIGLGGGYTGYDEDGSVEGTPATLKLLGSWYLQAPVVFDLGYGVNNQQFTQAGNNEDTAMTGGALEFAARYRWDSTRWQGGIVANQLYEQGPDFGADQGDAHFVGLQALKEFNLSASWLARLGARAMAMTNTVDNNVYMYLIDLQIGWNPSAYRTSVRTTENPMQTEEMIVDETEVIEPARPVAKTAPSSALEAVGLTALVPGENNVEFPTAQATVSPDDKEKLASMAAVLEENKDLYDRVEIRGYADSSGSEEFNKQISKQRAEQVRSILQQNGLKDVDVTAVGKGTADSTGMQAADRRAEVIFIGVKDEAKLRDALSTIE